MLIAEELLLLLRRDDGKAENAFAYSGYGLAAAALTDLILAERITVEEEAKDPAVTVVDDSTTGQQVLDAALTRLRELDGKKLSRIVTDGKLKLEEPVARSLADRGVVDIEEKRKWGFVPAKYPVRDPEPERRVRERLRAVLAGGTPTVPDATLLAIIQGLELAPKVLAEEKGGLSRRELKARIEEVTTEATAGLAVGKAVETMNTVMLTAVIIPVVVSGGY